MGDDILACQEHEESCNMVDDEERVMGEEDEVVEEVY